MRKTHLAGLGLAVLLAGSCSENDTAHRAEEAYAEAERANLRASDLEDDVRRLKAEMHDLQLEKTSRDLDEAAP